VEQRIADPSYDWFDGKPSASSCRPASTTSTAGRRSLSSAAGWAPVTTTSLGPPPAADVVALKDELTDPGVIAKLPQLLDVASRTVTTNVPPDKARDYMELAGTIDEANISRYVLGRHAVHHRRTPRADHILRLDLVKVAVCRLTFSARTVGTLGPFRRLPER
jgi:hypothetical protein